MHDAVVVAGRCYSSPVCAHVRTRAWFGVKYRCICVVTMRESSVSARGCESVRVRSTIEEIMSFEFESFLER